MQGVEYLGYQKPKDGKTGTTGHNKTSKADGSNMHVEFLFEK